jgi:hypothetical protein
MPENPKQTFEYRILRYTPNLVRDEWVNIGVLLQDAGGARQMIRTIEEEHLARVRRLHPEADLNLLRGLQADFDSRLAASLDTPARDFAKFNETLSTALQFTPAKGLLGEDFETEMARLYEEQVAPPPRARGGLAENARSWLRGKLKDVFRRHRVLDRLRPNVRVEEFTHPGDPFKFDYAYRNGARGYLQSVLLGRDLMQCKAMTYSAEHIHRRDKDAEFTAISDVEPSSGNARHQFIVSLFEEQRIRVVPMNRIEKFAEDLRVRLQ